MSTFLIRKRGPGGMGGMQEALHIWLIPEASSLLYVSFSYRFCHRDALEFLIFQPIFIQRVDTCPFQSGTSKNRF